MNKISSTIFPRVTSRITTRPTLTNTLSYAFSEESSVLLDKGSLQFRNSDILELKLFKADTATNKVTPFNLPISPTATLKDLKQALLREVPVTNLRVYSEEGDKYSQKTPVEALLDRFFTLTSDQFKIRVEGQLMHADLDGARTSQGRQLRLSIEQLEQPLLIQREIEKYIQRVETWLDAKYGIANQNAKIKSKEIQEILVQALVDPECKWSAIASLQAKWRQTYYGLQNLRKKYNEAVLLSQKMAKRRMYLDMILLASNVGFVGVGTYVVYSWDIIEPWAYFISSFASIYLFRKSVKFRKPFSLSNYKNYLIYEVYLGKAAGRVGLDLKELKDKQMELQLMETTLKDYLMIKI